MRFFIFNLSSQCFDFIISLNLVEFLINNIKIFYPSFFSQFKINQICEILYNTDLNEYTNHNNFKISQFTHYSGYNYNRKSYFSHYNYGFYISNKIFVGHQLTYNLIPGFSYFSDYNLFLNYKTNFISNEIRF